LIAGEVLEPEIRDLDAPDTYLEIPLESLRRDTDCDGLSDLHERRLGLDPDSADTDQDGLLDGEDPMPNVSLGADPGPDGGWRLAMLQALFDQAPDKVFLGDARARVRWREVAPGPPDEVRAQIEAWGFDRQAPEVFLLGERRDHAAFLPDRRVLVFSREELRRHLESLGENPLLPLSFPFMFSNRDRSLVFVQWEYGQGSGRSEIHARGGSFELRRTGDGFQATPVGAWKSNM
jgi:hypothetical protein